MTGGGGGVVGGVVVGIVTGGLVLVGRGGGVVRVGGRVGVNDVLVRLDVREDEWAEDDDERLAYSLSVVLAAPVGEDVATVEDVGAVVGTTWTVAGDDVDGGGSAATFDVGVPPPSPPRALAAAKATGTATTSAATALPATG